MSFYFSSMASLCFRFVIFICVSAKGDTLKPLLVTPLLRAGKILEAQKRSLTDIGNVTSYTGFFTVNETCGNNLFFWYFQSEENWKDAPVILWLNGGPGYTSMYGLFEEIGPWNHLQSGFLRRKYHWSKRINVIFIDQPVGVGFSYSENDCYINNINVLAKEVTSALFWFFKMFPTLQKNKFFLTGESYAGHYIPAIAMEVDKENLKAKVKINLKGIVIGNPLIDERCIYTADYLYQLGIIDHNGRDYTKENHVKFVKAVTSKQYRIADGLADASFGVKYLGKSEIPNIYNIMTNKDLSEEYAEFLTNLETRKKIHVGFLDYSNFNEQVFSTVSGVDGYISSSPRIEYLLNTNKYIVGLYGGQLDVRCLYSSIPCVVKSLKWPGASQYFSAVRRPWYVSQRLAGWVKVGGNFYEIALRGAGHEVPAYQPEAALSLITAAVADEPGSPLLTGLDYSP